MPANENNLIAANRAQKVSETDSFTCPRYRQFHSHFPASAKKILDVGCNTGRGGRVLKDRDASLELSGLDCVPERIAALDQKLYQRAFCGFTTNIPVEGGSFDVVVGGELIEHIPPSQVEGTLAEFFRVLRLGGRLLLTTPNPDYLKNKARNLSVLMDHSHVTQHFPDCLAFRLRLVGFSRVKLFGSGRVSAYLGQRFPLLSMYGSYLIQADKW